eukprot:NODE_4862_length_547_cov_136.642570_g3562_i0.p4 GENE.NODE_4862_length_547_cov_136.642570_g3562_i0~~NODE_4862_length_547_cov_136.642570_g3562_i0.p4  ORF type:complete len:65 (+),score=1.66 NODE_4862_length_547_cov_136.642570_g3562_i0:88-282(+)
MVRDYMGCSKFPRKALGHTSLHFAAFFFGDRRCFKYLFIYGLFVCFFLVCTAIFVHTRLPLVQA